MDLTSAELQLLAEHKYTEDDVFDGRAFSPKKSAPLAKREGKMLVLGVPCERGGYRIRTRAGACIHCNRAALRFAERHSKPGYVYVAGSVQKEMIKVGGTEKIENREKTLQQERYAGASDWRILMHVQVKAYGLIEDKAQDLLRPARVMSFYFKEGTDQQATEVYRCSFSSARAALERALDALSLKPLQLVTSVECTKYEFGI